LRGEALDVHGHSHPIGMQNSPFVSGKVCPVPRFFTLADAPAGLRLAGLGQQEGERAGSWRREFAGAGLTLAQADCLVAAAAAAVGARLATGNPKDFPMRDLTVEHWPVGL
jgi:hypothetical protein